MGVQRRVGRRRFMTLFLPPSQVLPSLWRPYPLGFLHLPHSHLWEWPYCEQNYSNTPAEILSTKVFKTPRINKGKKHWECSNQNNLDYKENWLSPLIFFFSRKTCISNIILYKALTEKTENPRAALVSAVENTLPGSYSLLICTPRETQEALLWIPRKSLSIIQKQP